MKNKAKTINMITLIVSVISIAVAVFRGFILINFIDKANGLYTNKPAGAVFLACMIVIAAGIIVTYLFLKKKDISDAFVSYTGKMKKTAYIMCALCFACLAAVEWITLITSGILAKLQFVLVAMSLIFFIIAAFKKQVEGKNSTFFGILGLVPALWAAIRAIGIFMDVTTQINSSERSLTLTLLVCVMMMFLNEAEKFKPLDEEEKNKAFQNKMSAKSYAFALAVLSFSVIVFVSHIMLLISAGDIGDVSGVIISVGSGIYAVSSLGTAKE